MARKKTNRSCGYCGTRGHTRRTCMALDYDVSLANNINTEVLPMINKWLIETNYLPIGSLLKNSQWSISERTVREVFSIVTGYSVHYSVKGQRIPSFTLRVKLHQENRVLYARRNNLVKNFTLCSKGSQTISDDWYKSYLYSHKKLKECKFARVGHKWDDQRSWSFSSFQDSLDRLNSGEELSPRQDEYDRSRVSDWQPSAIFERFVEKNASLKDIEKLGVEK